MLSLWVKHSLTTDDKQKLMIFNTSYIYNNQDDGAKMFFVVVKIVRPKPYTEVLTHGLIPQYKV